MNWQKFMDEKDYQRFLVRCLTERTPIEDRFRLRTNADFCRQFAMDKGLLIEFLETSQPDKMKELSRIYKAKRDETIAQAVNLECVSQGGSLIHALKHGVSLGQVHLDLFNPPPDSPLEKGVAADWKKNIFSVAREVWASDGEIIDHVIFLNGLAVATIEMKCEASKQTYHHAIEQYRTKRSPETRLLRWKAGALVHFAMDLNEIWMTTKLEGLATHFIPFNRGNGEGIEAGKGNPVPDRGHYATEYMWEDILTKETLSDIISRYVFIEKKEKKVKVKGKRKKVIVESVIFPRYHQLDCVRKVLKDVGDNLTSKNYLIMHSAGSGKTNSIAWLAHRLANLHDNKGENIIDTVIVVTDRVVVDRQLQKAVLAIDHKNGEIYTLDEDKTSADLAKALNGGTKIVATTIHKFDYIIDSVKALANKTFAVIIDEAHSSTNGRHMQAVTMATGKRKVYQDEDERDAEDVVRDILKGVGKQPNVTMLAFTATPKPHTLKLFGTVGADGSMEPFHVYSMKQAIEEEFIKDVLENYIEYKTFCQIVKTIADDPKYKQRKAAGKIKRILALHEVNIAQRTQVIVEHFREFVMPQLGGEAKAMIVTSSREEAVRYRLAFGKYIAKMGYELELKPFVAFTGKVKTLWHEFTESGMNGISVLELADEFNEDGNNILIVANKYQTGFDQPRLCAMYVLKKLSGVNAVQTLSRLNRFLPDKTTFVLDFVNTCKDMTKAFGKYYTSSILSKDVTVAALYDHLTEIEVWSLWTNDDVERFWLLNCSRPMTDAKRAEIEGFFSLSKKAFDNLDERTRKDLFAKMRRFVKWYDFMVQAAFLDDTLLYKKRVYIDILLGHLNVGGGGTGFSLWNKVDAIGFRQEKTIETHKPKIMSDPNAAMPEMDGVSEEDDEERLSKIIERLNSTYGKNLDPKVASKGISQIITKAENDEELKDVAKSNNFSNFAITFGEAATKRLIVESYEQSEEFYNLLLSNDEARESVLKAIAKRVYETLRTAADEYEYAEAVTNSDRHDAGTILTDVGEALKFREYLPLYSLRAACGVLGDGEIVEPEGWVKAEGVGKLDKTMVVVHAERDSMEPMIHDGDLCVVRKIGGGNYDEQIVLVQRNDKAADPESGGAYLLKKLVKKGGKTLLRSINREYPDISIGHDDDITIVASLHKVLH